MVIQNEQMLSEAKTMKRGLELRKTQLLAEVRSIRDEISAIESEIAGYEKAGKGKRKA
jgi:hypothetical protein